MKQHGHSRGPGYRSFVREGLAAALALALTAALLVGGAAAGEPQPGLAYQLFGGTKLERLGETGVAPDLDAMDKGNNDWGLRFTGFLTPPLGGEYMFRAEADTGVRLEFGGKLVIDGWARDGDRTGKVMLERGKASAFVVEYSFDRGQAGKKAVLRLFWTPPGDREEPVPASAYTHVSPLIVDLTLKTLSEPPSRADIAPYHEALIFHEYTVDRVVQGSFAGNILRVAHWAIYDDQDQDILQARPGTKLKNLELLPYDQADKVVQQAKQSDTLPEDFDAPLFHDCRQKLKTTAVPREQWDYRSGELNRKMRTFLQIAPQLRVVAIGDSRAMMGVDPRFLLGAKNRTVPLAYNLAIASAGVEINALLVRDYLMKLPRLEWVIWGISPRIFNRKWGDSAAGIRNSSGYRYDQEHPLEKQWRPFAGESVKPAGEAWGFAQNTKRNLNDYRARFENKADMDKLRQQVQKVDFELARNRLDMFEQILAGLKPRRIRVLGFTPPMHRAIADQPATDDNGVSQEGCDQIVKALQEMARKHDNFVFLDIDRKTHNDFENDDFYNFDHLSAQGAAKLTKMLDAEIAKFQETKEERQ